MLHGMISSLGWHRQKSNRMQYALSSAVSQSSATVHSKFRTPAGMPHLFVIPVEPRMSWITMLVNSANRAACKLRPPNISQPIR